MNKRVAKGCNTMTRTTFAFRRTRQSLGLMCNIGTLDGYNSQTRSNLVTPMTPKTQTRTVTSHVADEKEFMTPKTPVIDTNTPDPRKSLENGSK